MPTLTSFDKRQLRNVLGAFTTGVTIVTTRTADGKAHGVTANSFSSVSLEPPLVLWCQALTSKSHSSFNESDNFVVNILADDQIHVSNHFAKSQENKFVSIDYHEGLGGAPVISGSAAHLECVKVAAYPAGDHVVFIGRVERVGHSGRRPLAFGGGRYMSTYAHDLGPVSTQIGWDKPATMPDVKRVAAEMPAICAAVGQHTLCLSVWGNHGPTVVYWEASDRPISDNLRVGLVYGVTTSAAGRAFATFLPNEVTRSFVDEDLRLFRIPEENEDEQRANFEAEVVAAREQGMARVVDPALALRLHKIPTNAFAAPIFDSCGVMVMALTIISQVDRLAPDWQGSAPQALLKACREISRRLGYVDPSQSTATA
jgi:flavin reductase (DIM6/NTAB) family NADH-FMN oxidoreductase RutF/DNA-binding IclR family transcriptional regulator